MFLMVKRYMRVKGLTCADVRKQLKKAVPGDATTPRVSAESVLTTSTVNAHERHDVRICNTRGEFLSADMNKDTKMSLRVRLAQIMVNIVPQIYRHHMIYEHGRPVLYVTLKKAL